MRYLIPCIILLLYALIARGIYETKTFGVTQFNIRNKLVKNPVRFIFISDLHGACFGIGNSELIKCIDEKKPDAILIGGDMFIGNKKKFDTDMKSVVTSINLIKELCVRYPVYYTFGNHETRIKEDSLTQYKFSDYIDLIDSKNLHVLNNNHIYMTIKGTRFCLYGLEAPASVYTKLKKSFLSTDEIKDKLGTEPDNSHAISVVMAHNPDFFESLAEWGAPYVLSGHVHGGIIRLPFAGGLISTNLRLFPKYSGGLYKTKNSVMILSRGLGGHTIPIRLFNRPELVMIDFIPQESVISFRG